MSKIEIREKKYEFLMQFLSVASYGVWYNVWQFILCGKLIAEVAGVVRTYLPTYYRRTRDTEYHLIFLCVLFFF